MTITLQAGFCWQQFRTPPPSYWFCRQTIANSEIAHQIRYQKADDLHLQQRVDNRHLQRVLTAQLARWMISRVAQSRCDWRDPARFGRLEITLKEGLFDVTATYHFPTDCRVVDRDEAMGEKLAVLFERRFYGRNSVR